MVQLTNASGDICSFELLPDEIDAAVARSPGACLAGTFHSHVASPAEPGKSDIRHALGDLMLILDTCGGRALLWRIAGGRAVECAFETVAGRRATPRRPDSANCQRIGAWHRTAKERGRPRGRR